MRVAIENIGELVTLRGPRRARAGAEMRKLGIVHDAAVLMESGRISGVGTRWELREEIIAADEVIDAGGRCVTPGFVDAHTHLVFAGNRADEFEQRIGGATYQEIAAQGGGILRTVRLTREATEDDLLQQARRHRDWMLRGGTTTIEAKSGYGLDRDTELKMLRVMARLNEEGPVRIVPTLLAAHTLPAEFREQRGSGTAFDRGFPSMAQRERVTDGAPESDEEPVLGSVVSQVSEARPEAHEGRGREEYVRWVAEELIPEVAQAGLARYCDAFCDEHAFTVDESRTVLESAKRNGLGLRIHAEQFTAGTGAELAAELGAATADHLEVAGEDVLEQLRSAGVQPVLLPASVFALGRSQYPDARKMMDAGLSVVLASDFNPGSSPVASMSFVMSLACVHMRMLPSEALSAATINAAYSLGLGGEVGSIEVGKRADLLIHEFSDHREIPYWMAAPIRPVVIVGGQIVNAGNRDQASGIRD
jgi:imidazolonepropionase